MDVPTVELFETAVTFDEKHARSAVSASVSVQNIWKKGRRQLCVPCRHGRRRPLLGVLRVTHGWSLRQRRSARWLQRELCTNCAKDCRIALPSTHALDGRSWSPVKKKSNRFVLRRKSRAWIKAAGPKFGFKVDFFNATIKELQFPYGDRTIKFPYASIEGVLQITDAELIKRPLLRGIGSYRRVGLGLLQLSN